MCFATNQNSNWTFGHLNGRRGVLEGMDASSIARVKESAALKLPDTK